MTVDVPVALRLGTHPTAKVEPPRGDGCEVCPMKDVEPADWGRSFRPSVQESSRERDGRVHHVRYSLGNDEPAAQRPRVHIHNEAGGWHDRDATLVAVVAAENGATW